MKQVHSIAESAVRFAQLEEATRVVRPVFAAMCVLASAGGSAYADLVLETETAELGKQGDGLVSVGVQFEKDRDGNRTMFTLNQFEYGITDRAEILIEPFFYERDNPSHDSNVRGMGDLEITPSYMVLLEEPCFPAVVLAFKLKVPTGKSPEISTGKYDYYPYVILGKHAAGLIFNVNLGYNFITSPKDEPLRNQYIWDFSVEREITEDWSVYAEMFGNSAPAQGEKSTYAWAFATEYRFSKNFNAFVSVGDDSDGLKAIRFGFNYEFGPSTKEGGERDDRGEGEDKPK